MKRKLFNVLKTILAILFSITTIVKPSIIETQAAGYTLTMDTPYGIVLSPSDKWAIGTNNEYGYDVYAKIYINGVHVYCVEQYVPAVNGASDYTSEVLGTYTGNAQLTKKLEYISSLGYGFGQDYSEEMDFATQIRIWQEMGLATVTNIHPDIQAKIDIINQRLSIMESNVSFNRANVVLHGYGKEFAQTLTDSAGVFQYYHDYSSSGIHTERNENKLTIWAEKGDSINTSLIYDCLYLRTQPGTSIAYTSPSSQNVAFLQGADPKAMIVNAEVQTGTIQLVKEDSETKSVSQGDATLKGATFNVVDNKTKQTVGELVSKSNGQTNILKDLPTDRTYSITETTAPRGYILSTEKIVADLKTESTYKSSFQNNVIKGSVQIHKVMTDGSKSEIVENEQGAKFIVMLKKHVNAYGNIEEAYVHLNEISSNEYDLLTTNEEGIAKSKALPYGTYEVKQIEGKKGTSLLKESFSFTISQQDQTFEYTINNVPNEYYVRLIKVDAKTQQRVKLSSASFRIKDSDGNYVTMKVGGKKISTFITTSDGGAGILTSGYYSSDGEKGEVITPLKLKEGSYTVEEIKTPDGYLQCEPISFVIEKNYISQSIEDDDYIDVIIENGQPTGHLKVLKTIEENDSDVSFVESDVSDIQFDLIAKEDIVNASDGSVLFKQDDVVYELSTDENGIIEKDGIPMGRYALKEVKTKQGLVLDEQEYLVEFRQEDDVTKEYFCELEIVNRTTKVEFSKTDITGQQELEGASLEVRDENGEIIDQWISSEKPHSIQGLAAGKTYTLTETIAPESYVRASTIEFTIQNTGEIQTVEMIDKQVFIEKVDQLNHPVKGATLEIKDLDGTVLDTFKSGETHTVSNLEVGHSYILHEKKCPKSYLKAKDITFIVEDDQKTTVVTMVDTKVDTVSITKYDATDQKELEGAKLKVVDSKGNIVDQWISKKEEHLIKDLIVGQTYTLIEISAPDSYNVAESIRFTVEDNGKTIQKVKMYDRRKGGVNTAVSNTLSISVAGLMISSFAVVFILKRNKK